MDFAFGVLSYNSEEFILEALNSIKYQVNHYGNSLKVQLVIADDASEDNTNYFIKKWINKNGYIFQKIDLMISEKNEGTVRNYNKLLSKIRCNRFSILAGDDIYAKSNVIELFEQFKSNECLTSFPISLQNGKLFWESHRFARNIYAAHKKKNSTIWLLKKEMMGSYIHTPSTLFYLQAYDKETKEFVKQFKLYEDDPKWYMFLKRKIEFKYIFEPFIIYRYHKTSVSHGKSISTSLSEFDIDLIKLNNIYLNDENCNLFLKIYFNSRIKHIYNRKGISLYLFLREMDYIINHMLNTIKGYEKEEKEKLNLIIKENNDYYIKIFDESKYDMDIFRGEIRGEKNASN